MNKKTNNFLLNLALALLMSLPAFGWAKTKVVLISGRDSHGSSAHNWGDGVDLLSNALVKESGLAIETAIYKGGWPKDPAIFKGAATVVVLSDGGGRHPINKHLKEFDALAEKGVGLVCVHYAVEVPKGAPGNMFVKWIGGYFETFWSVNPHWTAEFKSIPKHPVANGVKAFTLKDEWYYHMRFREGMKGVTPILSALPPADTPQARRRSPQQQPGGSEGSPRTEGKAARCLGIGERERTTGIRNDGSPSPQILGSR